jgi:hypothetical protein
LENWFTECGKKGPMDVQRKISIFNFKNIKMKMVKMSMVLIVAISSFGVLRAQTADDIVNKYLDAIGGKEKIQKVKTFSAERTSQVMGNEGPSNLSIVVGSSFKLVSEINGQSFIQVFTDKGGWMVNPYAGATSPTALPDEAVKEGKILLDPFGPLNDYAAKGNKVELLGKEGNTFKLKVTNPSASDITVFVDTATYLMTKISIVAQFMGQSMEQTTSYSDYKKGDMDIVFPYTVELNYGGQVSITSTVKKIEINKTIDPAIFVMPKS